MKYLKLSQNKRAIVDDKDYEWLSQWKWSYKVSKKYSNGKEHGIAVRRILGNKLLRLHRVILNPKNNLQVDHINGNPLDNRRSNLRICSISENNRNKTSVSKSGFKNVYPVPNTKRWYSKIMINRKRIYLGSFDSKKEAALAYNEAAIEYHGKFANLNHI